MERKYIACVCFLKQFSQSNSLKVDIHRMSLSYHLYSWRDFDIREPSTENASAEQKRSRRRDRERERGEREFRERGSIYFVSICDIIGAFFFFYACDAAPNSTIQCVWLCGNLRCLWIGIFHWKISTKCISHQLLLLAICSNDITLPIVLVYHLLSHQLIGIILFKWYVNQCQYSTKSSFHQCIPNSHVEFSFFFLFWKHTKSVPNIHSRTN